MRAGGTRRAGAGRAEAAGPLSPSPRRLFAIGSQLSPEIGSSGIEMLETDTFKLHCFQTLTGTGWPRAPGTRPRAPGAAGAPGPPHAAAAVLQASSSWFLLTQGKQE